MNKIIIKSIFIIWIGARLAGGDLIKNSSTNPNNQQLFVPRAPKTIDSLDLENFLHPK